MKEYKYILENHHSNCDLFDIIENVANISSPLIRENRHSDVVERVRNFIWYGPKISQPQKVKPPYMIKAHNINRAI